MWANPWANLLIGPRIGPAIIFSYTRLHNQEAKMWANPWANLLIGPRIGPAILFSYTILHNQEAKIWANPCDNKKNDTRNGQHLSYLNVT